MARSSKNIQENSIFPYQAAPQDPAETASKEEYLRRLAEYLKDPVFRQIEGFPIGTDEDILALSDPPYYTACPNPFLPEILEQWQQERTETRKALNLPNDSIIKYRREPFAADVSEGKNDPIYNAHSYHTKVPHKAIMRYILHYTDPGDIILDGFGGTGMSGVAAQMCADKKTIEELGYTVQKDGVILDENGKPFSHLGARKAFLNDLSPAATFIAYNYNTPVDPQFFEREAKQILKEVDKECGWLYETWHPNSQDPNRVKGKINFTVWSDVFICPQCGDRMAFWDVAVDQQEKDDIRGVWNCPKCGSSLSKTPPKGSGALRVERDYETTYDRFLGKMVQHTHQVPALINYSIGNDRYEKRPDSDDLLLIENIDKFGDHNPFSSYPMMFIGERWGDTWRAGYHEGFTHTHHFYTKRNSILLGAIWKQINHISEKRIRASVLFLCQSLSLGFTRLNRYGATHYSQVNRFLSGTLYVASLMSEVSLHYAFDGKISRLIKAFAQVKNNNGASAITTSSSTKTKIPSNSMDYIFVDPPFGGNLMYSELNFLWEAWEKVFTNNKTEAIVNDDQKKGQVEYQRLMEACFLNFYEQLKPGRWMTVEFHNSQNAVWNAIQEALLQAGFMVADVRTLDKQQGTFKQVTTSSAVKQDLIISAYKPTAEFEQRFKLEGGSVQGAWDFLRQHLEQLPLPSLHGTGIENQAERMPYLLYDRMVAFHLVRGLSVPLSASEFYLGVSQRFLIRDGMVFTSAQAADYDRMRLKAERVEQLSLFVTDEQSAIQWLRQEFDSISGTGPQTYSDIQPHFIQQLHQEKYEQLPELKIILEQNFIQDDEERWYVPDLDRQADLDQLRTNSLLREFAGYLNSKGKLRAYRSEAVRAGFSRAWKERQYDIIVRVAERLPEQALQEDAKLKMYYDNALGRAERQPHQAALL